MTNPLKCRRKTLFSKVAPRHRTHHTVSNLELFFDLVFAVAVSVNADGFAEVFGQAEYWRASFVYCLCFFASINPWGSYSWFASGYDSEDFGFRLFSFLQMFASMLIAQGCGLAFSGGTILPAVIGYIILRIQMVLMLAFAYHHDEMYRETHRRHIIFLIGMQVVWTVIGTI